MGWTLCSHTVGGPLRESLVLYVVDSIGREFPLFSRPGGPERLPNRTKCPRVRFQGTSRSSRWLVFRPRLQQSLKVASRGSGGPGAGASSLGPALSPTAPSCLPRLLPGGNIVKLQEGDTVSMTGTVTIVHDDGTVTVWLHGYSIPITTRGEHFNLIAKESKR
jgi:hypothetical protein